MNDGTPLDQVCGAFAQVTTNSEGEESCRCAQTSMSCLLEDKEVEFVGVHDSGLMEASLLVLLYQYLGTGNM